MDRGAAADLCHALEEEGTTEPPAPDVRYHSG